MSCNSPNHVVLAATFVWGLCIAFGFVTFAFVFLPSRLLLQVAQNTHSLHRSIPWCSQHVLQKQAMMHHLLLCQQQHTPCFIDKTCKHVLSTVFEIRGHTLLSAVNPYLALSEQCWLEHTRLLPSPQLQNLHLLLHSQPRLCCCQATC